MNLFNRIARANAPARPETTLGSVPNKVSHHAPCSVLIVRTS